VAHSLEKTLLAVLNLYLFYSFCAYRDHSSVCI